MRVSSVGEMRGMDRRAVEKFGIAEVLLMENAGRGAASWLGRVMRSTLWGAGRSYLGMDGMRIVILCGGGNNGGDGLVVARHLWCARADVRVVLMSDPDEYGDAARTNYEIASRLALTMSQFDGEEGLRQELAEAGCVVDALFGTGLTRDVEGKYRTAIETINGCGKPVLSLDIPSGVNGDTGQVMGIAVRATSTVTFGLPKTGNLLYPGYELGGELAVDHISFPSAIYMDRSIPVAVNDPSDLAARAVAGHKGDFGDTLFVAGAASYFGAPFFSALSFMKAGGGYARLAAPESIVPTLGGMGSEIVFVPQEESPGGSIALSNEGRLAELGMDRDFIVLGPGLSLDDEAQELARRLVDAIEKPMLIDGDGITAIHQRLDLVRRRAQATILTPHPGEMARITGLSVAEIEADRIGVLRRTTADLGAIIVLKGAHSLIGCPDGQIYINMSGNPGMATAGSGDVLAGTIAAMAGLGKSAQEAARLGVFVHGLAGDLAAQHVGQDGMTARDIMEHLPAAMRQLRHGIDPDLAAKYEIAVVP